VRKLTGDVLVDVRLEMAERQVFELPLDLPDAETGRQRRIDVHCLLGHPFALLRRAGVQGPHVVQPVGQLDQHHADVVSHRQEHLAHALGPHRLAIHRHLDEVTMLVEPGHLGELGHPVDEPRHLRAEPGLKILDRDGRVLSDVVQQRGGDGGGVELELGQRLCNGHRMGDVGVTRLAVLTGVRILSKLEGAPDRLHIAGRQVARDLLEQRGGRDQGRGGGASVEHLRPLTEYITQARHLRTEPASDIVAYPTTLMAPECDSVRAGRRHSQARRQDPARATPLAGSRSLRRRRQQR
jgi:hypothetical protein